MNSRVIIFLFIRMAQSEVSVVSEQFPKGCTESCQLLSKLHNHSLRFSMGPLAAVITELKFNKDISVERNIHINEAAGIYMSI